jgi:hypothetical protein
VSKLNVASLLLSALEFIIGMLLRYAIYGCNGDEGVGCYGCDPFNETLAFLILGEFFRCTRDTDFYYAGTAGLLLANADGKIKKGRSSMS